jgi:hypothetical protein
MSVIMCIVRRKEEDLTESRKAHAFAQSKNKDKSIYRFYSYLLFRLHPSNSFSKLFHKTGTLQDTMCSASVLLQKAVVIVLRSFQQE